MTQQEAIKELKKAGLFATIHDEHSTSVAAGRVISTDPIALHQIQKGSRVDVYVSSGPEIVTVPGVVGKDQADARAALEDAGLRVTVHKQESTEPKDRVTGEDPGPGSRVARGSRVTITVSAGTRKVAVPDVKDRTQDEASGVLQGAGFTVRVIEIDGSTDQEGKVIRQSPSAGSERDKGSTVTIYVGRKRSDSTGGKQTGGGGGNGGSQTPPPSG
jgi:serine/threonine-protein kinase